jgi:hypothetical protein
MKVTRYLLYPCLLMAASASAQNTMTSSPYSMFGLGEMASGLYGQNTSMAGVTVGMREGILMNIENPAGLTALDSCKLFAEASAFVKNERYRSDGSSSNAFTGNFSAFSLGGRIMRRWYMSAGVTPYSFVGYYFKSSQELEGSPGTFVTSTFSGTGGLSKAFLSQGFSLTKHLSVGMNLNFIFGNMTLNEIQSAMTVSREMSGRSFYADFGLQYHRPIARETFLTVGAIYGYKQRISLKNTVTVTGSSTETPYNQKRVTQYLPQYIGIGSSLAHKKWTYALDYLFRQYGVLNSSDSRVKFRDSHELRLGVCYFPNGFSSSSYWKRMSYKAGVSTPYLRLKGQSGGAYRVSVGLGLPVLNGRINTAFYYDRLQLQGNALRRDIMGFTVTYTLSEKFYQVKL